MRAICRYACVPCHEAWNLCCTERKSSNTSQTTASQNYSDTYGSLLSRVLDALVLLKRHVREDILRPRRRRIQLPGHRGRDKKGLPLVAPSRLAARGRRDSSARLTPHARMPRACWSHLISGRAAQPRAAIMAAASRVWLREEMTTARTPSSLSQPAIMSQFRSSVMYISSTYEITTKSRRSPGVRRVRGLGG